LALADAGIDLKFRPSDYPLWQKGWRKISNRRSHLAIEIRKFLDSTSPDLVVFSTGKAIPPIEVLELSQARSIPFVTIGQCNNEAWWPEDDEAERLRHVLASARRCYFVSRGNWSLAEKQIGCRLQNAELVFNPFNVDRNIRIDWPEDNEGRLLMACVGRLHPASKGQHILLEALAAPRWADRPWSLRLYGEGRMKETLRRLADRLRLSERVCFAGHVSVEEIWATNHVLVLPSRYEGLPLVIVEAMLCGRPAVVTDVAGNADMISDGETGFLAKSPTVRDFADALEALWSNRARLEKIGGAAAAMIRQLVPPDPVRDFVEKIKGVLRSSRR
jgi:glycosyltransferase involved in cell wall biosynthesis